MVIPALKRTILPSFDKYPEQSRDQAVYAYLFELNVSHRKIDEEIFKQDPAYTRGYLSMGILHHLGIVEAHKSFFSNSTIEQAIAELQKDDNEEFREITSILIRYAKIDYGYPSAMETAEDERIGKIEGRQSEYKGVRYERNPLNRKKAIEIHGCYCHVCGFDFEKFYGEYGKDFIEIHHITPLATLVSEKVIDPYTDLIPLCSNCHRIVHRKKGEILSIVTLKKMIETQQD